MKAFIFAVFAAFALAHAKYLDDIQKPDTPFGECPKDFEKVSTFLMDTYAWDVYYQCDFGNPIRRICPQGLVFNPRLNVCDFPSEDSEPFGPIGDCPKNDYFHLTFLRDGANVNVFHLCFLGRTFQFNCGEGHIFDPKKGACYPKH